MAHTLERNVRVHQTLHGYADGHRLLAYTTKLKPRDQKTMLLMSDASGAGGSVGPSGYLTGYPLSDSGYYAIARTWPAIEMARPGCVWTHTLLLEFADLASLPSMSFLARAFVRPSDGLEFSKGYSVPLVLEYRDDDETVQATMEGPLKKTLTALYEYPKERVLCASDEYSDHIALLVWAQQWPRLRRSFRFCTLAFSDRSLDGAAFDLQFAPLRERSIRSRFSNVIDAEKIEPSSLAWLQSAVEDIISQGARGLRYFLKNLGGDLAGGREIFVPLCQLHEMIPRFADTPYLVDDAIALLDSGLASSSGISLRSLLVSNISHHAEKVGVHSLDFLIENIGLLSVNAVTSQSDSLGRAIWQHDPHALLRLLDDEGHDHWARHAISLLNICEMVEKVQASPDLLPQLFEFRHDLLYESSIWKIKADWNSAVLHRDSIDVPLMLDAVVSAGRADLAREVTQAFSVPTVLKTLSRHLIQQYEWERRGEFSPWFNSAAESVPAVADYLANGDKKAFVVLVEIAIRTSPDSIPNDFGTDPWFLAIQNASGHSEERDRQILSGYLLARAFGYRSRSQLDLIEYGFDEIFNAALRSQLCDESWRFLQSSLPRSWVSDWDRCQRLREAIADLFVNRPLPPEGFPRITRNDSLFAELAKLTSFTSRGRKYLKKVLQHLKGSGGPQKRIEAIEDLFWW